jgi:hypothetical protein
MHGILARLFLLTHPDLLLDKIILSKFLTDLSDDLSIILVNQEYLCNREKWEEYSCLKFWILAIVLKWEPPTPVQV